MSEQSGLGHRQVEETRGGEVTLGSSPQEPQGKSVKGALLVVK